MVAITSLDAGQRAVRHAVPAVAIELVALRVELNAVNRQAVRPLERRRERLAVERAVRRQRDHLLARQEFRVRGDAVRVPVGCEVLRRKAVEDVAAVAVLGQGAEEAGGVGGGREVERVGVVLLSATISLVS